MRVLILTLLIFGAPGVVPVEACKCAPRAPCAEFWRPSAVFAGTVRELASVRDRPGSLAIRFEVDQRGRGIESDTALVESEPQNGFNCGYTFHLGERYVVYAYTSPGGQLTTDMCSGTKPARAAAADLALLEEITGKPRGVRHATTRRLACQLQAGLAAYESGGWPESTPIGQ